NTRKTHTHTHKWESCLYVLDLQASRLVSLEKDTWSSLLFCLVYLPCAMQ
ncbi:unnamed protein product, partial [Musa hybrid cultivar]